MGREARANPTVVLLDKAKRGMVGLTAAEREERTRELLDDDRLSNLAKGIINRPQFEAMIAKVAPLLRQPVRSRIWPLLHIQLQSEIPEFPEAPHASRPS